MLHGFKGKINRAGKDYDGAMPPWGSLSDAEIAEVLTYVRSSWSNKAGEVKAEQVANVRAKTAGHGTQFEESELSKPL